SSIVECLAGQPIRTAVYGPVRTVVWEGSGREACPYPDHQRAGGTHCPQAHKLSNKQSNKITASRVKRPEKQRLPARRP
ncbi:hypothetical protein, partial [Paraburkholderia domus]|uniref:hypothetical protein n=1 Tax=Paraburkholderia domus TaxID=2793075 RepID=UPI001B8C8B0A